MFVVIFEVQPKPDLTDTYLGLAQHLRPMVGEIDGFLDVERFASRRTEGRLLSISLWRDESALARWRMHAEHRRVQAKGRTQIFSDYRLRVGEITADTESPGALAVEQSHAEIQGRAGKTATLTELSVDPQSLGAASDLCARAGLLPDIAGLIDREAFTSIYTPGKVVLLGSWRDAGAAAGWRPAGGAELRRHQQIRIVRDYGMFDRREAPRPAPAREAARP